MGHLAKFRQLQRQKKQSNENSEINPEEENPLITISYLMDQVSLKLVQAVDACTYLRRFNTLISFMRDKEKVEMVPKESTEPFRNNEKMLFGLKFEQVVAKSLTLNNKLRELFGILKEQGASPGNQDSRKQQPFFKAPLFHARGKRGRGIFLKSDQ